jgi:hypothetical protein
MADTQGPENPIPLDPYVNYTFRLEWDGAYVAGFGEMNSLAGTSDVVQWRSGGDPGIRHRAPGQRTYEPVLRSGVAIQTLKLENEGWERDTSVQPPDEPQYTLPAN